MSNGIEWGFPGPIPYSYMHVSPKDLGITSTDPYELGVQFAVQLNLWMQGLEAGKKIDVTPEAPSSSPLPDTALAERNLAATPMTEPTQEEAQDMISKGLNETAPWEEEVKAEPKPWQKGASASAAPGRAPSSAGSPKKPVVNVKVSASVMDDF